MNDKTRKILITSSIIAGIGLFAYSFYYYFKKQIELAKKFEFKILSFNFENFDTQLIKGKLNVLFQSVSDLEIVVKEFAVDFYFNGVKVGYLEDVTEFIVPANSNSIIPLEFVLNPQLIIRDISDIVLYSTKKKDANIDIVGYATIKSGFINLTLPIEYSSTLKEMLKDD